MAIFKKRRAAIVAEVTAAVLAAIEQRERDAKPTDTKIAGDFFNNSLEGMSKFLNGAADLALRGAASAMGQRGGRKKAENRRAREALQRPDATANGRCPLCVNPMRRDVTIPMILAHKAHEQIQQPDSTERAAPSEAQSNGNGASH